VISNRPVLLVGIAWASLEGGEMEAGESRLDEAESLLRGKKDSSAGPDGPQADMIVVDERQFRLLHASIANARAYHSQTNGDAAGTLKYAQQALDLLPEDDYMQRVIPAAMVGFVYWEKGDLEAAYQSFSAIQGSLKRAGVLSSAIGITFVLADLRITQGRLNEAANLFESSLQLASDQGDTMPLGTEDVYRGISELHLERGNLEAGREYLNKNQALSKQTMAMDWQYRSRLLEARVREVQKDLVGALDLLNRAEKLYYRSPMPDLRPVAALKARIWIKQGKLTDVINWAREHSLSFDDKPTFLHEFEHLTHARMLIAMYRNEKDDRTIKEVIELLDRLLEEAEKGERNGSVLEILIMQALAYEVQDTLPPALKSLERALSIAEPEGYLQIFVDEGTPMKRLLAKEAAKGSRVGYIENLMAAFNNIP
jgi:LuxR family maltose regulon positive regulatory protein